MGWHKLAHLGEMRELATRMVLSADRLAPEGKRQIASSTDRRRRAKASSPRPSAAHVGFSVQFVGETNDKNGEPSRSERLAALLIANAIGAVARRTNIVVDEADDVFDAFNDADRAEARCY